MSQEDNTLGADAVPSPQVTVTIAEAEVAEAKKPDGETKEDAAAASHDDDNATKPPPISKAIAVGPINPFLAPVPAEAQVTRKQPFILTDQAGNEKTFGSALGLLTRKFVNLIHQSQSGSVDMNESAILLNVPKRRIYDITNVLEGVGLIVKRSKNTVAWKGSEAILGDALDPATKLQMKEFRTEIDGILREEAFLDQSLRKLCKLPLNSQPVSTQDIIQAIFYYSDDHEQQAPTKEALIDVETGKPQRALLAIHAPMENSVAHVFSTTTDDASSHHKLYIGTRTDLEEKYGGDLEGETIESSNSKKRKVQSSVAGKKATKTPRTEQRKDDDKIKVFLLPTVYDEEQRMLKSQGVKILSEDPSSTAATTSNGNNTNKGNEPNVAVAKGPSWDVAEQLANDEGVSDFFGGGDMADAEAV